jgi:hypothetical protein
MIFQLYGNPYIQTQHSPPPVSFLRQPPQPLIRVFSLVVQIKNHHHEREREREKLMLVLYIPQKKERKSMMGVRS